MSCGASKKWLSRANGLCIPQLKSHMGNHHVTVHSTYGKCTRHREIPALVHEYPSITSILERSQHFLTVWTRLLVDEFFAIEERGLLPSHGIVSVGQSQCYSVALTNRCSPNKQGMQLARMWKDTTCTGVTQPEGPHCKTRLMSLLNNLVFRLIVSDSLLVKW